MYTVTDSRTGQVVLVSRASRDLLRAARANIAAAKATHALGNTGLAFALLVCARDQIRRASAWWLSMRVEP